jgi:geranylgeranyl diphosphate synthase type II
MRAGGHAVVEATAPSVTMAAYLGECRDLVLEELRQIIPKNNRYRAILYDLMFDYALREGKALRPALCIATCRALGGRLHDVLPTAAVLELFHNAFLVHDDIEDGSLLRRGLPTLQRQYGVPIAVNVGDGMYALCLQPLLDNAERLGLGKALRILQIIARMARESVEGQAIELDWARGGQRAASDRDYCLMTYKKTCWYTFIAPIEVGAVVTDALVEQRRELRRFARFMGIAFQIQDDILNLTAMQEPYGKEIAGDLWEGKHTLMLLHALRSATPTELAEAESALSRSRGEKSQADVELLLSLIRRYDGVEHARALATKLAVQARETIEDASRFMVSSVHRDFLIGLPEYVIVRDR